MNQHPDTARCKQEKIILLTLIYFDIFTYPLKEEEIACFAPGRLTDEFRPALLSLVDRGTIFRIDNFYSLNKDIAIAERRKAGNELALLKMHKVKKYTRILSSFPFVRAVMLSGSISKGYMDEQSDIDYFIITEAGRLWIVRTALALFRRIFLLNSHKYFCTNYFVGNNNLEIGEKNIFTAVETATLKPVYGKDFVYEFQAANTWFQTYLPNRTPENGLGEERDTVVKKLTEKVLSHPLFDRLDHWLMKKSVRYWKRKYGTLLTERDFLIAFQSTPSVSRSHPFFYQKKVLSAYLEKIKTVEQAEGISLSV